MLTPDEQHFLDHLPAEVAHKKVTIHPYSNQVKDTADGIISAIRVIFPDLDIRFMGASGLGISGQNDIDIYLLSKEDSFPDYFPGIEKLFGPHSGKSPGSIAWKFTQKGYDIELYLTDPESPTMRKQIKIFDILKNNPSLLKEYEQLKERLNGATFKEYQTKKYDFYHRILSQFHK